ncbi:MAG: hypothetical protein KBH07_07465 [Flavobacteriales bacterium]|nr:hypothetical protein [Flavobacteriales bacterium]MBP9080666.1 hypothetical protein [Flavobacteriales bacterium]
MRLQLDDNQRGAVHYLLGGVLLVGLLRGAAWLVETLGPDLSAAGRVLRPYQQGYWGMRDELAVAGTTAALSERMLLAVVCAFGAAVLMALLCAALLRGKTALGTWATRATLVLILAWCQYAALLLPVAEARLEQGQLVLIRRKALFGEVPVPFTAHQTRYSRAEVDRIQVREVPPETGCDGRVVLDVFPTGAGAGYTLATEGGICADQRLERLRNGSEASALLERELR